MPTRNPLGPLIGKKRPFENKAEEAFLNLWRTAALCDSEVNRLLREHDLTKASYNIVRILDRAGNVGRTGTEVAEMLVAELPDMARLIDRLERLGYIRRGRVDEDRRLVRNFITTAGHEVVSALHQPLADLHRRQFAALSETELDTLISLLETARVR